MVFLVKIGPFWLICCSQTEQRLEFPSAHSIARYSTGTKWLRHNDTFIYYPFAIEMYLDHYYRLTFPICVLTTLWS